MNSKYNSTNIILSEKPGARSRRRSPEPASVFKERVQPPNFFVSVLITTAKMLMVLVVTIGVGAFGLVLGVAKGYFDTTPELNVSEIDDQALTSFIYDMNGELITAYKGSENRVWAGIGEIPEILQNAFVALEDARFWTHDGVDYKRIAGAFFSNLTGGSTQGGSTITAQLIKLRVLSTEVSYKRKLQEAYLAIELEDIYTKKQILESYLNSIWLGESNYGVKAAAKDYFGKELGELTIKECAMLAGLTKNPTSYNPRRNYYVRNMPEITDERTERALYALLEHNYITYEEYQQALAEPLNIVETSAVNKLYPMPYAVETVLEDVIDAFLEMRGLPNTSANRSAVRQEIQSNGYNIYTTIDSGVQEILEDVIYNWDKYPKLKNSGSSIKRAVSSNGVIVETEQPQAAAVVYDYAAGELRAVVGSRQPPTQFLTLNLATKNRMPVGSSIKPIAVYGPALDLGYSPSTVVENMEIPIEGWKGSGDKGYPANSSANTPYLITLRQAMVRSLNIASVHTLIDLVGVNASKSYVESFGVNPSNIIPDAFGLAMGSSGIPAYEMAVAFGSIANTGVYQEPISFTKVTDSKGNVILDMKAKQDGTKLQVLRPGTAYMLVDMLVNAVRSGTGTNARISNLTIGGKTGTNSEYYGAFFAGFSPYYSCTVWVGHEDYEALASGSTGGSVAAPIFKSIMENVHNAKGLKNKEIIPGAAENYGLVQATTCAISGLLATDACYYDEGYMPVTEWHHADSVPTEYCASHQFVEICSDSGELATQWCDHTTTVAKMVISPDLSIFKYDKAIIAPFWPNALYARTRLAVQTPAETEGGDPLPPPPTGTVDADTWAAYLESLYGNGQGSGSSANPEVEYETMTDASPYCHLHNQNQNYNNNYYDDYYDDFYDFFGDDVWG